MPVDPSVLAVLRSAADADPTNAELGAHLAEQLLAAELAEEALARAQAVLALQPDHLGALATATAAAERSGHPQAASYRRILDALAGPASTASIPGTSEAPDPTSRPAPTDDADRPEAGAPRRPGGPRSDAGGSPDEDDTWEAVPATADELLEGWADTSAPTEPAIGELERPTVTLADVGGLDEVKRRLHLSFLGPMRNPEMVARFGKSLRGGLLLWGPPGCGKTFLAKAVAGELGANFYDIGVADVLDPFLGVAEGNIKSLFDVARRNRPCVLFMDELDALGRKRSHLRMSGASIRGVVNQLLAELDGVSSDNEGLFVLAATNHPWDVDPALLRPGRFDHRLLVLPPDEPARRAILAGALRGRPVERIDLDKLAKVTDGLTGADLVLICESATEEALADSVAAGQVRPITQRELLRAAKQARPSIGGWVDTARNYALFNNEGNEYDELLAYLRRAR